MIAQVSYGSRLMREFPQGVPMEHSTCRALDNSRDQHMCPELLDETNIDILHTLYIHPIQNLF
jgi:hypothetical protein